MNKLLTFKILLLFIFFGVSCSTSENEENHTTSTSNNNTKSPNLEILHSERNDSLYTLVVFKHDESMLVHDENMPKVKRTLKQHYEDTNEKEVKDQIMKCLRTFNKASEDMFAWMRGFQGIDLYDEDYKAMQEQEVWDYLQSEEQKIEVVAAQIDSAMVLGDSLLSQLTK